MGPNDSPLTAHETQVAARVALGSRIPTTGSSDCRQNEESFVTLLRGRNNRPSRPSFPRPWM